jgi:hypothetical protein
LSNKVLIEGASIAAFTAASRLSKFKYSVVIDGQCYQNTVIQEFNFDYGDLFTLPAVYRDFFQKTGKHFGQVLDVKPMDPAFEFQFEDMTINFANLSRSSRIAEIENKLGKEAAIEWDAALKQGEYLWDKIRENYVEWEFSLLRFNPDTYLRIKTPIIRNPYLRAILSHYATYLGYPAGIYKWSHILAFVEESFGVWQISGGLGALTTAIKDRAIDLGTTFGTTEDFDYYIDATQIHTKPAQRLIGIENYPTELPIRIVRFNPNGLTADIYTSKQADGRYSIVVTGDYEIKDFDKYIVVDQIRAGLIGNSDDQVLTRIRTANKRKFKVRHLDTLSHAGITGELLANAVRGIKNRPSHEH